METNKGEVREQLEETKREFDELGGWKAVKSGQWLLPLIRKSFNNYWARANSDYFKTKYRTEDPEKLGGKLIAVAAKNASILGTITGAAVSADEIVAVLTAGEMGIGLAANLAIAGAALSAEGILLVRFQLQLVANLGKVYGAPLDPDDPEDILTILAFALGGSVADAAGTAGMKIGGKLGGQAAKAVFEKEVLAATKRVAAKVGVKILQRTIVKYAIPAVSIVIGTGWNYFSTRAVGRIAIKHFKKRIADIGGTGKDRESPAASEDTPPESTAN